MAAIVSSLSDGAAPCVLMSSKALAKHVVKHLASIVSYGGGACELVDFATSPVDAVKVALRNKARMIVMTNQQGL